MAASVPLRAISSMATRQVLAELLQQYRAATGVQVQLESVGGVDAEQRVAAGEAFDLVLLASAAIGRLAKAGHVLAGSCTDLFRSDIWVAVREGAPRPAIDSAAAIRAAVLGARSLGYSTGPSGNYLTGLFRQWGIWEQVQPRLAQARPGVPVGSLIATGEVELGFQQRSELVGLAGVDAIGPLPAEIQHTTVFSAAIAATCAQAQAAGAVLQYLASAGAVAPKLAHGMAPA